MEIESIYAEKDNLGCVKISILVKGKWYVAINDCASFMSHYCEVDNCILGKELSLNRELNALHN